MIHQIERIRFPKDTSFDLAKPTSYDSSNRLRSITKILHMNFRKKRNLTEAELELAFVAQQDLLAEIDRLKTEIASLDLDNLRDIVIKRQLNPSAKAEASVRHLSSSLRKFAGAMRKYRRIWTYDPYRDHLDKRDVAVDHSNVFSNLKL